MVNTFNMDNVITENLARKFAIQAHGDQQYGDQPYSVHLDAVAALAKSFGAEAEAIAYLHDVVEDTTVTLLDIEKAFGCFIARCVAILTDEPGANRRERKKKTYQKMAEVEAELNLALIVKVCDRLANVNASLSSDNERMLEIYRQEHPVFRSAAYRAGLCDNLWVELDSKLAWEGTSVE